MKNFWRPFIKYWTLNNICLEKQCKFSKPIHTCYTWTLHSPFNWSSRGRGREPKYLVKSNKINILVQFEVEVISEPKYPDKQSKLEHLRSPCLTLPTSFPGYQHCHRELPGTLSLNKKNLSLYKPSSALKSSSLLFEYEIGPVSRSALCQVTPTSWNL